MAAEYAWLMLLLLIVSGLMLLFDWIEQMTGRGIVGFTCETHGWDY
jgi:hypothetical protein